MPSIIHSLKKPQSLGRIGYQYNLHYSSLQYIVLLANASVKSTLLLLSQLFDILV